MEIQQLRHFLMAVKYSNIGQAAEALNITQSGLSRSLKNLEGSIGLPLLIRSSRGVTPSQYGEMLIPNAQIIVNERDKVSEELREIRQGREGGIRIGITTNFSHYFVPDVLKEFKRRRPNVGLYINMASYPELIESLQLAKLDIMFGLFPPKAEFKNMDIKVESLFDSQSQIVCPTDHSLVSKPATAEDLAQQQWGLLDSSSFQDAFKKYFSIRNIEPPRITLSTNSVALLRQAVNDLGLLTILPTQIVSQAVERKLVETVDAEVPAGFTQATLAYRSLETTPPAMKQLLYSFRQLAGLPLVPAKKNSTK